MFSLAYLMLLCILIGETSSLDLCSFKASENETLPRHYSEKDIQTCGCEKKTCIRACCKPGYFYWQKACHLSNETGAEFYIPVYKDKTLINKINKTLSVGILDCGGPTNKLNKSGIEGMTYIQENGVMLFEDDPGARFTNDLYCYDAQVQETFICGVQTVREVSREITDIATYISMPLLLVTFVIYMLLPVKTNHQLAFMSYDMSFLLGCIFSITIKHSSEFEDLPCILVAVVDVYFVLVSFLWMNIMCFDIWITFKNILPNLVETQYSKRKKFILYSIYAWGLPLLYTISLTVFDRLFENRNAWYHPNIATRYCFVDDGAPRLMYFYGPMTIIIVINTFLFVMTSIKIYQKKKEEKAVLKQTEGQRHMENKQNFSMYIKLMIIMGLNWSLEVLSSVTEIFFKSKVPYGIWVVADFWNGIYGFLIFIIYGFNKKVWKDLRKRYGCKHMQVSASVETMTTTASSTTGSRVNIANTSF